MDSVMSKRLRASIRAGNKGRSLRPKAAQMRSSSSSLPPDDVDRPSSEPPEPSNAELDVLEAAAPDPRTKETLREGTAAPPSTPPARESLTDVLVKEVVAEITAPEK